ncbi:MAG TPA: RNase H family protein [Nitrospira sp.]|nr:RNase H family protein [Nitrospira sp.]
MRVTVMCDASHCPETHVAGYGFWLASSRGSWGGGGRIVRQVSNPMVAEMMAIANSLWIGLNKGTICSGDHLLIQSDCIGAMDKLTKLVPKTKEEIEVRSYFTKMVCEHKLKVDFRHVRGHTGQKDARSCANHHCDRRAYREMRYAREEFKQAQGIKHDAT